MGLYAWVAIGGGAYLALLGWGYLGLYARLRRLEAALGRSPDEIAETREAFETITRLESSIARERPPRASPRPRRA